MHRSSPGKSRLPAAKRRLFLAFTLAFPLVLVGLAEVILRLVHYGPDLSLFETAEVNGRAVRVMNPQVSSRYFYRTDFQPGATPDVFLARKEPGSLRIFCLGASTTVGYPYWYNAAFPAFLEQRLEAAFPGRRIEVVNLGITATNSFTVLDLMPEVLREQPDAVVVYDGHNEFYGALGVASRESAGGSRGLVGAYLWMLRFKSFLLLRDLYAQAAALFARGPEGADRSTMMERMAEGNLVPADGPLYRRGVEAFQENVASTAALCRDAGVPLLLCTQVSNLRDLPPFVSLHAAVFPSERSAAFDSLLAAGDMLRARRAFEEAAQTYRAAVLLDSAYAGAHYRLANTLDSLGEDAAALEEYRRARDADAVRFRASSDINRTILRTPSPAIPVDIERWFEDRSPKRLVGGALITEHLHPTAYGQFEIAQAVAAAMRQHGLFAAPQEWERRDTLSEAALWQRNLVTPLDERIARRKTEVLTAGWPFRPSTVPVSNVAPDDTLGQIVELVMRGRWNWYRAHEAALAYFEGRHDDRQVEKEHAALVNESPLDVEPRLRYARFLMERARYGEMRTQLLASLAVRPTILAYRALGDVALRAGRGREAVDFYVAMRRFPQGVPEQLENGYLLALAYLEAGARDSASVLLRQLLELRPDYKPAADLLGRITGG